jgi:hypothetical protein
VNKSQHFADLRSSIMAEVGSACEECGKVGKLHAHHLRYPGRDEVEQRDDLIILCPACHKKAHQECELHAPDAPHMIRLSDATHDRLREYAFRNRLSFGKAIDDLLDAQRAATDPRTPAERAADDFAAEVLDTQASDRP